MLDVAVETAVVPLFVVLNAAGVIEKLKPGAVEAEPKLESVTAEVVEAL